MPRIRHATISSFSIVLLLLLQCWSVLMHPAEAFLCSPKASIIHGRKSTVKISNGVNGDNGEKETDDNDDRKARLGVGVSNSSRIDNNKEKSLSDVATNTTSMENFVVDECNNINQSFVEPFEPQKGIQQQTLFDSAYVVLSSAFVGSMTGFSVCLFKLSIESLRELLYGTSFTATVPIALVPAIGGLGVSALAAFGKFSPGLERTAKDIDILSINPPRTSQPTIGDASSYIRKPLAACATLGSGNSLGPEGPSVEIGMSISRVCMPPTPTQRLQGGEETYEETATRIRRNRLLLKSGAAAGVAAGFNAPLAGVFFALEIIQQFQPPLVPPPPDQSSSLSKLPPSPAANTIQATADTNQESIHTKWFKSEPADFLSGPGSITAILLSSVMSALVSQVYLGDSLALNVQSFDLKEPLMELPLYLLLGIVSGFVAGGFSFLAQLFKGVFDGEVGPDELRYAMASIPKWSKPVVGGLIVGSVGSVKPQVLFFGYETLNTLLAGDSSVSSTELVLSLLVLKTFTTAISAGCGLVGGTFAPSLFLGGMVGASFHAVIGQIFLSGSSNVELADVQAYALVGAAGVLAALFRAPLTASLLLFELTRDYEIILPVVAAASVGSVIGDLVEKNWEEKERYRDGASWGDLSDEEES